MECPRIAFGVPRCIRFSFFFFRVHRQCGHRSLPWPVGSGHAFTISGQLWTHQAPPLLVSPGRAEGLSVFLPKSISSQFGCPTGAVKIQVVALHASIHPSRDPRLSHPEMTPHGKSFHCWGQVLFVRTLVELQYVPSSAAKDPPGVYSCLHLVLLWQRSTACALPPFISVGLFNVFD